MDNQTDIFCFDAFALDLANRQLRRSGQTIDLGSRYFDALVLLVRESGTLVPKERFMEIVWRGIPVTDEALTQCIRTLRRALGDDAARPRFIATVPKHGYRFIAQIQSEPVQKPYIAQVQPARLAGACTVAGAASGAVGGLAYAMLAGQSGASGLVALAAMVGALGTLAGAGIGLALAGVLAWRVTADGWLLAGGMLGGMATGAFGSTLGREGIGILTSREIGPVTGILEGAILGLTAGAAAWMMLQSPIRILRALFGAAVAGAIAGAALHGIGGTLLGGSLWSLQQSLGRSRLMLEHLGHALGERDFGPLAHFTTAVVEAGVFTLAIAIAAMIAARKGAA